MIFDRRKPIHPQYEPIENTSQSDSDYRWDPAQ
jgi:hypothetical protein